MVVRQGPTTVCSFPPEGTLILSTRLKSKI